MPNFDSQTIQLAIVAIVALAMLVQTIVLLAIFVAVRRSARSMREDFEDLRSAAMPILYDARDLYKRVAPKVEGAAADLAGLAHSLRVQTADVQASAAEIVDRLRHQASRLDAMMTTILDAIDRTGNFMTDTVAKPMRQLSGLLAAAKAVVESLRTAEPAPRPQADNSAGEKDMFV
jgi:hypothetical protein